ncbi:ribokinase [candidate division KSB1 bacterium]|nr:ribokinase [candidate division KSB1 bacterium]
MNKDTILVVGSANMDMVVQVDHFPKPGETILGRDFGMFPGGKGANQAVCCAKLNYHTCFMGKMGEDVFHQRLSQSMQEDGVDLRYLLIDSHESTGVALISVDQTGENQIIVASGTNMQLTPRDVEAQRKAFEEAKAVLTQLEIPLKTVLRTAELAREYHTRFILNPAPAQPLPDELFGLCDFITPNETELEILTGKSTNDPDSIEIAAKMLLAKGVKNVIVTLGAEGALWVSASESRRFSTKKVQAVDSTAAGDAFNGAFVAALAGEKDIPQAIQSANRVATFTVTKRGAQTSMPTLFEVEQFYKDVP